MRWSPPSLYNSSKFHRLLHLYRKLQTNSRAMVDSRVDTISRLAQWRIDSLGPCNFKKSDPFKLGIWNWYSSILLLLSTLSFSFSFQSVVSTLSYSFYSILRHLSVEKSRYLHIRLFPEPSKIAKEQPPIARFYIRVSSVGPNRRPTVSPSMSSSHYLLI